MKFELDTTDGRARRGRLVFDLSLIHISALTKSLNICFNHGAAMPRGFLLC